MLAVALRSAGLFRCRSHSIFQSVVFTHVIMELNKKS